MSRVPLPAAIAQKPLDQLAREIITRDPEAKSTNRVAWMMALGVTVGQEMRNMLTQVRFAIRTQTLSPRQVCEVIDAMIQVWDDTAEPDFDALTQQYEQRAKDNPGERPVVYNEMGSMLRLMGQLKRAYDTYMLAYDWFKERSEDTLDMRAATWVVVHLNLAGICSEMQQFEKAEQFYQATKDFLDSCGGKLMPFYGKALVDVDYTELTYNWALCKLMRGPSDEALDMWRCRVDRREHADNCKYSTFNIPVWSTEDDPICSTDRILVWTEQGIGDEIMCLTLVADLLMRTNNVTILCTQRLVPIARRMYPSIHVDIRKEPWPSSVGRMSYDYQMSIRELMLAFRPSIMAHRLALDVQSIAPVLPPSGKHEIYRMSKGLFGHEPQRPFIGISWRSTNAESGNMKSILLADLLPILQVPDCAFVNLQYGNVADEILMLETCHDVKIHQRTDVKPLQDLESFAELVRSMDLVISVSNTTVHFAGITDTPCWAIIPKFKGRFWYWYASEEECMWYGSVKFYRPDSRSDDEFKEDRAKLIAQIAHDLQEWVAEYRSRNPREENVVHTVEHIPNDTLDNPTRRITPHTDTVTEVPDNEGKSE